MRNPPRLAFASVALVALAVVCSHASAEMITTLFASNNQGSPGGMVYFDITVGANPIDITAFETNTNAVGDFGFEVWTTPVTHVGVETMPGLWASMATGLGTGAGPDVPSPVALSGTISLAANTSYGMAIALNVAGGPAPAQHLYTNGDGTNQMFANADVQLDLGAASNAPFTPPLFDPRVWNGSITYNVVPGPGGLAMLAMAGIAFPGRRRRRR